MGFLDWLRQHEARARKLTSPGTHGKAPAKRKPATGIDGFIREIDALKKDLDALDKKKKAGPEAVPVEVGDEELIRLGKVALANLGTTPGYYANRPDEDPGRPKRKVTREEAARVARQLGVDFKAAKFTAETFRKAIESEIARSHKPSTFDKYRRSQFGDDEQPDRPDERPGGDETPQ